MILSCGIDIEEIERFNKHYFHKGKLSDLMYDIFTTKEIDNLSVFGKEAFLKGFCFKEAFYKAINNTNVGFLDIQIIFSSEKSFEILKSKELDNILNSLAIKEIQVEFQTEKQYIISKVLLVH
ncbi:MAG: 4'-phosphopantetheinyl transferase superfamily protein [Bacteroidetes bacterium]|nr:4'-phosphopantetheinyl transferase superfamily protein [Bacteroidota bacterium]